MSESRVIDLDAEGVIAVTLGGRQFEVRQQRRAVLERVLRAIYAREQDAKLPEDADTSQFLESCFANWRDRAPTFALILGYEEGNPDLPGVLAHLEEHLTFPRAKRVFDAWWELNQLVDFFALGGNPMIPDFAGRAAAVDGAAVSQATPTSS